MVREELIVDLSAPEGVETLREIHEPERLAYRDASVHRERLVLRVDESKRQAPLRSFQIALIALWIVGFALTIALGVAQVLLFIAGVTVWSHLLMARHDGARGIRHPGFRGTFRFEAGWLHGKSTDRPDVTADLARMKNVHILETTRGRELRAKMQDGEEIVLATAIAEIEVARYVAKRIADASNEAKR